MVKPNLTYTGVVNVYRIADRIYVTVEHSADGSECWISGATDHRGDDPKHAPNWHAARESRA